MFPSNNDRPLSLPYFVDESRSRHILFRIHMPHCASPLIWTESISSSGFSSPNTHLASLSPISFEPFKDLLSVHHLPNQLTQPTTRSNYHIRSHWSKGWTPGPYLRHTMVDHILGKWRQTCIPQLHTIEERSEGVWEDKKSPWISASKISCGAFGRWRES
ncbi:hypothetical protein IAR55_001847 [Kwoniella newhampshirensis]|uniref:Uncharacterized protein n=1 Tax=Kwoniella newhampshirensis TaxID=1651941 RepID=A0AAW0Z3A6_9TREE